MTSSDAKEHERVSQSGSVVVSHHTIVDPELGDIEVIESSINFTSPMSLEYSTISQSENPRDELGAAIGMTGKGLRAEILGWVKQFAPEELNSYYKDRQQEELNDIFRPGT